MAYLGIAAGGLTVLTGLNGQISLGHGALMAVGAYTTALPAAGRATTPLPLPLVVLVAVRRRPSLVGAARRRWPPPGCTGPTSPARPWPSPSACPASPLYFEDTLGGEQGLRVRAARIPRVGARRASFFVTGSDLTPAQAASAYVGAV